MKIRAGFVSNSSSASFVIHFDSDLPRKEIEKKIRLSDGWLDKYWDEGSFVETIDIEATDLSKTGRGIVYKLVANDSPVCNRLTSEGDHYYFATDTTMFNDWHDVPGNDFIRALQEDKIDGIKLIKIIKTYDENNYSEIEVEYDPSPWMSSWTDAKHKKEARLLTQQYREEFLEYLKSIDSTISDEEMIELAKYKLNK